MIRMDSLVVVTRFEMNAIAYMRIPFVQVLNFRIHFHASTPCENIRCSSQTITEIRLESVLFRDKCKLAETICNLLMAANSNATLRTLCEDFPIG